MENRVIRILGLEDNGPNQIAFRANGLGDVKRVTQPFKIAIFLSNGELKHQHTLCAVIPKEGVPLDMARLCGMMADPKTPHRHCPRVHQEFLLTTIRNMGHVAQHHDYDNIVPSIEIEYIYPENLVYTLNTENEHLKRSTDFAEAEWHDVKFEELGYPERVSPTEPQKVD